MSGEDTRNGSNVLAFRRVAKKTAPAASAASELRDLLFVYDQLIALLRETYDEGLDVLTDSIVDSVVRCRAAMAKGIDDDNGPEMVKEMRAGLRQIPSTLRALLPGIGPRLGESMERKLGIQFAKY